MNPGPAGIPQFEYIFSRIVCISVPLGFTALLVILIVAGIKYLMSGGEPKAISQAHQTVTWGLLGIVFLAISWLILQLIQNFTGIEVTKFTLSSLPGVEGFTGSCWNKSPDIPNLTPNPKVVNYNTPSFNPNTPSNPSPINNQPTTSICGSMSMMKSILFNECTTITLPTLNLPSRLCLARFKTGFTFNGLAYVLSGTSEEINPEQYLSPLPKTAEEVGFTGDFKDLFNLYFAKLSKVSLPAGTVDQKIYFLNADCTNSSAAGANPSYDDYLTAKIGPGSITGSLGFLDSQIPPPAFKILDNQLKVFNGWVSGNTAIRFMNVLGDLPGTFYLKYPKNKIPIEDYEIVITQLIEDSKSQIEKDAKILQENDFAIRLWAAFDRYRQTFGSNRPPYTEQYLREWEALPEGKAEIEKIKQDLAKLNYEKYFLNAKKMFTSDKILFGIIGQNADYYTINNLINE